MTDDEARVIDLRTAVELAMEYAEGLPHDASSPNAEMFISAGLLRLMLDMPAGVKPVVSSKDTLRLYLRVDSLPDVPYGRPLHLVQFIYEQVHVGAAVLKDMRVTRSEDREP